MIQMAHNIISVKKTGKKRGQGGSYCIAQKGVPPKEEKYRVNLSIKIVRYSQGDIES